MASQAEVNEAIGIRKTHGDKDDEYAKKVIETATPEQLKIAREEVPTALGKGIGGFGAGLIQGKGVVKKAAGGRVGKSYRGYGSARCN